MNVNLDSPSFFLFLFFFYFFFFYFFSSGPPSIGTVALFLDGSIAGLPNFHEGSERSEICVFVQWSMNRLKYEFN